MKLMHTRSFPFVDDQNWHKSRFARQTGRTSQTGHVNRSDRSRQLCQIVNRTSPLCRSCRDDRNAYIERPIWTPDEEVMPPGRSAPRSDRSDMFGDRSYRSEMPNPI